MHASKPTCSISVWGLGAVLELAVPLPVPEENAAELTCCPLVLPCFTDEAWALVALLSVDLPCTMMLGVEMPLRG